MDIFSYNGSVSLTEKGKIFYSFFLRFLKENKCFYTFQRAFCGSVFRSQRIEYLIKLCNQCNTGIISNSFLWRNTIEGQNFWACIDRKFKYLGYRLSLNKLI